MYIFLKTIYINVFIFIIIFLFKIYGYFNVIQTFISYNRYKIYIKNFQIIYI